MTEYDFPHQCAKLIKQKMGNLNPKVAIILGSGLGGVISDNIEQSITLSYTDLPGFPEPSVAGHAGKMLIGKLHHVPVICLRGRAHLYEGTKVDAIKTQIRTLSLLGIKTLIITNAAGILQESAAIGSLMLISDHINLQGINPLVGPNDDFYGERFTAMDNAYDAKLRQLFQQSAQKIDMLLPEGVYIGVLGPSFETPAEIRAFAILGANLVGMSTVNEVILARHCGLKVVAISAITNLAAGLSTEKLSHQDTLVNAKKAERNLTHLLYAAMEHFRD